MKFPPEMSLGARLEALRKSRGMTYRAAAKVSGVSHGRINAIEKGAQNDIGVNNLLRLCAAYGTTLSELTRGMK